MSTGTDSFAAALRRPTSWPVTARWAALLGLSALISLLWSAAGLPAALLLGPMIGGIVCGVNEIGRAHV